MQAPNEQGDGNDCPFCRIGADAADGARVGENDLAVAFLDRQPVNRGHVLVIPRRHVASFLELTSAELACIKALAQEMARALMAALPEYAGLTLSLAEGEAAGQEVLHAHFHVIPRHSGDGFGWRRFGEAAGAAALAETARLIRGARLAGGEA